MTPAQPTMKLSEAIREGAKLRPQGFGAPDLEEQKSCALVAAVEVVKGNFRSAALSYYRDEDYKIFPILETPVKGCPSSLSCNLYSQHLASCIVHLNDDHMWSREAIADYVATLEQS